MRKYCYGVASPKDEKANQRLLNFSNFIESINKSDHKKITMAYEVFRQIEKLENLVFTIGTYDNDTKAKIVYFNHEPDGKVYHASFDENGTPYIEVD